ncbi:hypothetical protein ABOK31_16525 [Rhizobium sp. ZPR4]
MASGSESENEAIGEIPAEFAVDQAYYLNRYQDVAAAIEAKTFQSAEEHFRLYGLKEGRIPNKMYGDQFLRWLRARSGTVTTSAHREEPKAQVEELASLQGIEFFQSLDSKHRYWRARNKTEEREVFIKELVHVAPSLGERERIFVFNWLLANHEHSQVDVLLHTVQNIDDERILPSLAKAVDVYCIGTGRLGVLRDKLLRKIIESPLYDAALGEQIEAFTDGLVRSHACEIHARYNVVSDFALPRTTKQFPVASKKHIFVGFFGQLRFPQETLPRLADLFRTSFPRTSISFGLATWDKQGVRVLADDHPVNFACEQLPADFEAYCLTNGIHSVRRFSKAFPAIAMFLKRRAEEGQRVDADLIRGLVSSETYSAIDPDSYYMSGAGAVVSSSFPNQPYMLNQGRMWNRIARLGEMLTQAEKDRGAVTDVFLLRTDLRTSGDLVEHVKTLVDSDASDRRVLVDYDAHAIHLTGVGDRFFFAKREAAARIMDAERVMQETLQHGGFIKSAYYWLMQPHSYPQTLLYQHGLNVINIFPSDFGVQIYRGKMDLSSIREWVEMDLEETTDSNARAFLVSLLT